MKELLGQRSNQRHGQPILGQAGTEIDRTQKPKHRRMLQGIGIFLTKEPCALWHVSELKGRNLGKGAST